MGISWAFKGRIGMLEGTMEKVAVDDMGWTRGSAIGDGAGIAFGKVRSGRETVLLNVTVID